MEEIQTSPPIQIDPDWDECLHDLCLTYPEEDRAKLKLRKNRVSGTCEWIIGTKELDAWLESGKDDILWLYGDPGTGKSTMAIFLTEQLSESFEGSSGTEKKTLAYFFCESGNHLRKTATSIIRGLLYQIVHQHPQLRGQILAKWRERGKVRGKDLFESFDALWAVFIASVMDQRTGRKYFIIDALDECDRDSQDMLLRQFEQFFSGKANSNVRVLITSRHEPWIRRYLKRFANENLGTYPQRAQDIESYIEERVTDLADIKYYTKKVRKEVSEMLREKAEGTFLWVGLACEQLAETASCDAVDVLENIPKGLDSLYKALIDRALEGETAKHVGSVMRILQTVAVSLRPLSILELSEACELHENQEDIETREQFIRDEIVSCHFMVIIRDEKVILLHQSVRDYLKKAKYLDELEAQADLASRCIDVIIQSINFGKRSGTGFPIYASTNWTTHARLADSKFAIRDSQAVFFDISSPSREKWLDQMRAGSDSVIDRIPLHSSLLHLAVRWGLPALAVHAYNQARCRDISNFVSSDGLTPLELAARSRTRYPKAGNDVLRVLLDHLEDNVAIPEEVVKSAIGNRKNGEAVLKLLLDRRGDQITISEEMVKTVAAENWESGEGVIRLLLDSPKGYITITEEVLEAAADNPVNAEGVMRLLLNRRGDRIKITERVVLAAARGRGNAVGVMTLFLDCPGDPVPVTEQVLIAAAENWKNAAGLMRFFLDLRRDLLPVTEKVVTAAAGNWGSGDKVVKVLLDRLGDRVVITEGILKAAVRNRGNAEGLMKVLLNTSGQDDRILRAITEGVIKAASENETSGSITVKLLQDRRHKLMSP